jgi:hypothetical protein
MVLLRRSKSSIRENRHKRVKIEQKSLPAVQYPRQPEESDEQKRQIKLPEAVKRYFQIQ